MLNGKQKAVLKAIIKHQLQGMENAPSNIQLIAMEAMLSFKYYIEVADKLETHDVHGIVKKVGEMLSHPAPQNPAHINTDILPRNTRLRAIDISKVVDRNPINIRKGLLNLTVDDTPGAEATQNDVFQFIQKYIQKKIQSLRTKLKVEVRIEPLKLSKNKKVLLSDDYFAGQTVSCQLQYLGATSDSFKPCDDSNFKVYQQFLKQFKSEPKTIEGVNKELKGIEHNLKTSTWG